MWTDFLENAHYLGEMMVTYLRLMERNLWKRQTFTTENQEDE